MKKRKIIISALTSTAGVNRQTECPLFGLPAEVRNIIYDLALSVGPNSNGTVVLRAQPSGTFYNPIDDIFYQDSHRFGALTLLRTCRLVYREAYGLFYSSNHLELRYCFSQSTKDHHHVNRLPTFINLLDPHRLSAILNLTLTVHHLEHINTVLRNLRRCRRLKTIHLQFTLNCHQLEWFELPKFLRSDVPRERALWRATIRALPLSLQHIAFGFRHQPLLYKWRPAEVQPFVVQDYIKLEEEIQIMFEDILAPRQYRKTARGRQVESSQARIATS